MPRGGKKSTSFKKGDPKNPGRRENRARTGSGRGKGTINKFTGDIRQAIIDAINDDRLGGLEWFVKLGQRDLRSMAGLIGKAIPNRIETQDPDEVAEKIRERNKAMMDLTGAPDEKKEKKDG